MKQWIKTHKMLRQILRKRKRKKQFENSLENYNFKVQRRKVHIRQYYVNGKLDRSQKEKGNKLLNKC